MLMGNIAPQSSSQGVPVYGQPGATSLRGVPAEPSVSSMRNLEIYRGPSANSKKPSKPPMKREDTSNDYKLARLLGSMEFQLPDRSAHHTSDPPRSTQNATGGGGGPSRLQHHSASVPFRSQYHNCSAGVPFRTQHYSGGGGSPRSQWHSASACGGGGGGSDSSRLQHHSASAPPQSHHYSGGAKHFRGDQEVAQRLQRREQVIEDVQKKSHAFTAQVLTVARESADMYGELLKHEAVRIDIAVMDCQNSYMLLFGGKPTGPDPCVVDKSVYAEGGFDLGFTVARRVLLRKDNIDLRALYDYNKCEVNIWIARRGVQIPGANVQQGHELNVDL